MNIQEQLRELQANCSHECGRLDSGFCIDCGQSAESMLQDTIDVLVEDLDLLATWLKACLECEEYYWDSDQRDFAEQSLKGALRRVAKHKSKP